MKHNLSKNKHQSNAIRKKYKNKKFLNKQFANQENSILAKKKNITKNIYNKLIIGEVMSDIANKTTLLENNYNIFADECQYKNYSASNYSNEHKCADYYVIDIKKCIDKIFEDKLLATYEIV
jgi:hypothetical protein